VGGEAHHGLTMAQSNITIHLRSNTKFCKPIALTLCPLVWIGIMDWWRAVAIAARFARIDAHVEGWGGD